MNHYRYQHYWQFLSLFTKGFQVLAKMEGKREERKRDEGAKGKGELRQRKSEGQ